VKLLAALALCALAACGQKGPLTLPDEPRSAVPASQSDGQSGSTSKDKDTDKKQP
jgi:predicted small lipoprotein YifL